ncbi:hypothetical protein TrLO_g15645, partial [Triparma laevis f. longispina]
MKSSQSPSEPAALAKPALRCGYPTCPEPAPLKCYRCLETHYCSAKHQKEHWPLHKKLCVAPQKKMSAPVPPLPLFRSRVLSMRRTNTLARSAVSPSQGSRLAFIVKALARVLYNTRGLWLTSYKNLRELASGEGFNEYFQKQFNGNEEPYLRWKEAFDVLEIVGGRGCHHNVRVHLEAQALSITRSEDLVKLRALAKLCSRDFFDDPSLLVVAWRRIFEVLELAMPEEKKAREKKKKKKKKKK